MGTETVILEQRDSVAWIILNRPDAFNAINTEACEQLAAIAAQVSRDSSVRAVVLTGAGKKAFCAGGDVSAFAEDPDNTDLLIAGMTHNLHTAVSRLAWMEKPVIAAVNGVAAGAGLSLVACSDLAISVDTAKFTSAYTGIGLTPDGSSSWFLPRLIGARRTMDLYMNNRTLSANEALDWGLLNYVVSAGEFEEEVTKLSTNLANGPTKALGGVKKLLLMSDQDSLESQMERETRSIASHAMSPDGREGIKAFVEKRKAVFKGV